MIALERKIFLPDGDGVGPHPFGVCRAALNLRDQILEEESVTHGRTPIGVCTRRHGLITGCLISIVPLESEKKGLF